MYRFIFPCLITLATPTWADIARPDTVEDTLKTLHSAVIGAGFADAVIDWGDTSVVVGATEENGFTIFPDNLHRRLQTAADDRERQTILDGFVQTLGVQVTPTEDFTLDQIMPRLQHLDYLAIKDESDAVLNRPFVGDLVITYVIDYPTHTSSMSDDMLAAQDLTMDTLHTRAIENLIARSEDLKIESSTLGVYYLTLDGFYENAMMLDAAMWDSITAQIGPIAVTVPTRDFVMIAPMDDADVVADMRRVRDETLAESPYPLSNLTFTWSDGNWEVLPE